MSVSGYKNVEANGVEELNVAVAALRADGWTPLDGAFPFAGKLVQTLIKGSVSVSNVNGDAAAVANEATVAVVNSEGADSHNATATVADNALTNVQLAATVALVDDGDTVSVEPTGEFVDTVTFAVTDGAITGIALS